MHADLAKLVGSWRLVSATSTFVDTGETSEPWGSEPEGRMVLEPGGRIVFLFTRRDCQPPVDDAQRARMYNETAAYTGIVRLDGRLVNRDLILGDLHAFTIRRQCAIQRRRG